MELDGRPLAVDTRKATAILAYVAVSGHVQSRDIIATLLWPEYDGERSRAALRRTLSTLRTSLGGEWLVSDRGTIGLNLDQAWFDLAEFRRASGDPDATVQQLTAAVDLHRGHLLEGFSVRDSAEFDDWQRIAADGVRRELATTLDRLVETLAAGGHYDQAVARAEQRLALDPLHEPAHRRLIELYASAGRRGDALAQYRECVRTLDRELGVGPLTETTELYNAVNEGRAPEPMTTAAAAPAPSQPLVGRDGSWRSLTAAYEAIAEDGRVVVVEGESGVGKTRLAEEFLRARAGAGARVVSARAHPGERGLAYGVLAQLLRAAVEASGDDIPEHCRAEAARLLPELGQPPAAALGEPGARQRFLDAAGQLLTVVGDARAPGIVFVDDLHASDPASVDALTHIGRRLQWRRVLWLAARRTDEPDPDHACAHFAELGDRVILGRLTAADVDELARAAGLDEEVAGRLFTESEGLPLYLAELLVTGDTEPRPGPGAQEVFSARLDAVTETASQVLAAAAVIGRTFDVETVRATSGRSDDEVVNGLEELETRGLIVERDAEYDFAHERLRMMVEQRAGLARRRLLHGRVAEVLAVGRGDPALIARHLELAGQAPAAAESYLAAGDRARDLAATAEALDHYRTALALGHPRPGDLHESLGDVHTLRGEYRAAVSAFEAAAALADPDHMAELEQKLGAVHERRSEWDLAERHYQAALQLGGDAARIQADRSLVARRRGDDGEALRLGTEALQLAEEAGDPAATAQAHNILGLLGAGREHLELSLELSAGLDDSAIQVAALNNLALDCAADGDLDRAQALIVEALHLCAEVGDRHREAALRNNLADMLHQAGESEAAMEELKRAVAIFAEIGEDEGGLQPGVWRLVEW